MEGDAGEFTEAAGVAAGGSLGVAALAFASAGGFASEQPKPASVSARPSVSKPALERVVRESLEGLRMGRC